MFGNISFPVLLTGAISSEKVGLLMAEGNVYQAYDVADPGLLNLADTGIVDVITTDYPARPFEPRVSTSLKTSLPRSVDVLVVLMLLS